MGRGRICGHRRNGSEVVVHSAIVACASRPIRESQPIRCSNQMQKVRALVLLAAVVCCRPGPPPKLGARVDAGPEFACTQAPPPDAYCPPEMVLIPRGTPVLSWSKAPRRVDAFCIDRLEITLGDYRTCVAKEQCRPPHPPPYRYMGADSPRSRFSSCDHVLDIEDTSRDAHPAHCIDYEDAMTFCQARHARLPTEYEWEYAARGCDGRPYPWGKELPTPERAVIDTNDSAPVGTHPAGASPFGVLDMHGNVSEWVMSEPPSYAPDNPMFPGPTYTALEEGVDFASSGDLLGPEITRGMGELGNAVGLAARSLTMASLGVRCASEILRP